ncbi:Methionine gamma-lyase [compost metagenome]
MTARPDKQDPNTLSFETLAVHGGNEVDTASGAIRTPIVMANSYHLPTDPSDVDWSDTSIALYTRNSGHNQIRLQQKLAAMEQGEDAAVFATGVAALHAVFFTLLRTGDHVVVSDVTYEAVWRLFAELLPERYQIEATFVDTSDIEAVKAAIRPNTKLIHTETIANPTTKVSDIAALSSVARQAGVLLSVDSTFTPPPLFRPLASGADLVIHSLTKYINGHGDAMGGAVIGSRDLIQRIKGDALVDVGGSIAPFNAWLIMRGSVTLPLRLAQHCRSAEFVAHHLSSDPRIAYVHHPSLQSHPQHEIATRQFGARGFGGVIAFALEGDPAIQNRFVSNLKVITSAVSLGHDESLIVHVGATARGGSERWPDEFRKYGHLRLSVGLEETDDLITDIATALDLTFDG